nr:SEC10/PgrA surface exclusion domain-containing protein [Limosilactobacillus fastidiosus]
MTATTIVGIGLALNKVQADSTTVTDSNANIAVTSQPVLTPANSNNNVELYSDNLVQVKATQTINFPSGYTLDAIKNIPDDESSAAKVASEQLQKTTIQGMYDNDYQSDPQAAQEKVDIRNLTDNQVREINNYGLSIVNKARAEFGKQPFTQTNGTINTTRNMALEYQTKNESLMTGSWHDTGIIGFNGENIAAFQIYDDNIPEFNSIARPFATAKGIELVDNDRIPLFKVTTMDDLRAMVFYGITGMLFNDADDYFGHAKNFLTIDQPITTMGLYPSLLRTRSGNGSINGRNVNFWVENVDMHYLWVTGSDSSGTLSNIGVIQGNWDTSDNGNYAWLDNVSTNNDGQLAISGWHATNLSNGRNYHYIIVLDQNNHEIARTLVEPVSRPDVLKAHGVYNANNSGFSTEINLGDKLANTDYVRVISRYSSSADGNSDYVDYWFNPVKIDQNNYACLDSTHVENGKLQFAGWHATNQSASRKYHYIILIDRSNGSREIARQLVTDNSRPDVAKVYPNINGAAKSGFKVGFDLNKLNLNRELQIISRYTDDPAGNGNYIDYWFSPITGNYSNQGYLDHFAVNNSGQVVASGWHANDITKFEQNHFIILYDLTSNKQVAVMKASNVTRNDVARVYPTVKTAANSGFSVKFDLPMNAIVSGHKYVIVSRYSTNDQGNGDQGQYTDYWYDPKYL